MGRGGRRRLKGKEIVPIVFPDGFVQRTFPRCVSEWLRRVVEAGRGGEGGGEGKESLEKKREGENKVQEASQYSSSSRGGCAGR